MQYNPPDTRRRIEARRKLRKAGRGNHARPAPKTIFSRWAEAGRELGRRAVSRRPPRGASRLDGGSQVRPGARRAVLQWVLTGRPVSLVLFLAAIGALTYLFTSPRFNVESIAVEGNSALTAETLVELSGLHGQPIWFVDDVSAMERMLQSPYVEQASVKVALPNRAVISVVERRPEVRWQLGGAQYLVDSTGRVLDAAEAQPAATNAGAYLTIVDTSPGRQIQPGDQVDPDALKLAQLLALRLPNELGYSPAVIGWDFALGVYVKSPTGQTIVFGSTEQIDRKLTIFNQLLKDSTAFTYLDLRPSNPFYQGAGG